VTVRLFYVRMIEAALARGEFVCIVYPKWTLHARQASTTHVEIELNPIKIRGNSATCTMVDDLKGKE